MATVKVKVRPSSIAGRPGTLYYQVIHCRTVKQITTNMHIHPCRWNEAERRIAAPDSAAALLQNRIDSDMVLLQSIIDELESTKQQTGREYSAADIVERFRSPEQHISFAGFMSEHIRLLTGCNRLGTAKNYRTVLESLNGFLGGRALSLTELTPQFVEQYSEHLLRRGLVRNSLSFHMRILRAVYNKAVGCGLLTQSNPFRNVYTGVDRTRKRAVDKSVIARLAELDLSKSAPLSLTRDLFLFSLYTRGMSFVDMAFLRRENIRDGEICYTRRKTGRQLSVRIEPCMQQIIDRYSGRGSRYLFPLVKSDDTAAAYSQYRVSMAYCNRLLKRLSRKLDLQQSLSFYAARHSWATLARDCNVPVSVISAGMGHSTERTTRIYLTSLENSLIDNANRGILNNLNAV